MPKKMPVFYCDFCDFTCSKYSNWSVHLSTLKHKNRGLEMSMEMSKNAELSSSKKFECGCGKKYMHYSGLWKHKKMCQMGDHEIVSLDVKQVKPDLDMGVILSLIKQNQEFKELIIEQQMESQKQHQEFLKKQQDTQNQFIELVKDNVGTNQIITNNHKITNNQFNLNFFLNETCKDAMNIYDFMDSIQIQLDDLDYTGANGYVAGVSRIFLRELKKLDVCKRPIHCTDVKREIFHVKNKDNEWHKERELLITTIKEITRRNVVHLNEWRNAHPGCMEYYHKKNDQYLKIQSEILGAAESEEDMKYYNKIISSVAKETMVDKQRMKAIT